MDVCLNCGSSRFEEENGLYFCSICQTQRLGRTQEVAHEDFGAEDIEIGEVSKKRKKIISTGVLWTTPEAFNHILLAQLNSLMNAGIVEADVKEMVQAIWFSYLSYCEIVFWSKTYENRISKLHSAARFRDIQVLRANCNEVPLYKYAKSSKPKRRRIRFGNRVIKGTCSYNEITSMDESEIEDDIVHGKNKCKRSERLFSSEVRRKIKKIVYNDYMSPEIGDTESSNDEEDVMVTERCKKLKTVYNSGYLTNTKHIHSSNDCFIGILTLPKTIAILNLALKLCSKNVFTGDLLLWIKQGHIPYFNTLLSLPKSWKILSSDCRTFVPTTSPTFQNIDATTLKIAKALRLKCLPPFDFFGLVERYVEDLNLPKVIVDIMRFQDVFQTSVFSEKLLKHVTGLNTLPSYEVIALMSIVLVLKRLFGLDGKSEKLLSNFAQSSPTNFVWKDWELYARLRLDCLKHYYVPIHDQGDSIRDVSSVVTFYNQIAEHWRPKNILSNKKDDSSFRKNLRSVFHTRSCRFNSQNFKESVQTISLFHLNSATDSILERVSHDVRKQLTVNFRTKDLSFIENCCVIYHPLKIGSAGCKTGVCVEMNWSNSFVLLLELSCLILQCKMNDLYIILNQLERMFVRHHWKMIRNKN